MILVQGEGMILECTRNEWTRYDFGMHKESKIINTY
jgi:hypothetical protein